MSGATNNLWSVATNWTPNGVPVNGDDLIFPAGASNQTNTDDTATLTTVSTMVVTGGNYNMSGTTTIT